MPGVVGADFPWRYEGWERVNDASEALVVVSGVLSSANLAERGASRRLLRLVLDRLDRERERGVVDIFGYLSYGARQWVL